MENTPNSSEIDEVPNYPGVVITNLCDHSFALEPFLESCEADNHELTPGTLAIFVQFETFDEYFHCCGKW